MRGKQQCPVKSPTIFFLPDGKNSTLNQIANTWTFGRLTPDGNESVGVEISYLQHAYSIKYYIVDQVNGHINAIHNDNLESTEFVGRFCPFDLDELELQVCKIMDHLEDEEDSRLDVNRRHVAHDAPDLQQPSQPDSGDDSDLNSRLKNLEDATNVGLNSLDYSPIPLVRNEVQSRPAGTELPTSTPRNEEGPHAKNSDPLHNRGTVKVVNSFVEVSNHPKQGKSSKKVFTRC